MNLGTYAFPRPGRGASPYPWIEADPGDWFTVRAADMARARASLRACRAEFRRRVDWAPVFQINRAGKALRVERIA